MQSKEVTTTKPAVSVDLAITVRDIGSLLVSLRLSSGWWRWLLRGGD